MRLDKIILAIAAAVFLYAGLPVTAKEAKKDVKKVPEKEVKDTAAKKEKISEYRKLMKGFKVSAKGAFMNLYRDNKDKIYIEYPKANLGREILAGSTIRTVSDPATINVGYKYSEPDCFRIDLQDSLVILTVPSLGASSSDPEMKKAMDRNYTPKIFKRMPVAAFSPDSSSFIFDATELVNDLAPDTKAFTAKKASDKSTWFGEMKAFDDNASVVVHSNMETSLSFLGIKVVTGDGSLSYTVSFLLLPQEKMKPRIQDSRVGVFSTGGDGSKNRYELSTDEDGYRSYRLAERWKIEPSDTAAWQRGELVSVKKPIVWYVDDAFPESWKTPVKNGILRWNKAFEKIGLKDVMVVKDFPSAKEDPQFDPDNLKYTCIRYIPNATMNAMGPSWVDPVTGEILNASVLVYNDVIRLINNWRFVQTAQVDERVRGKKLPQDVMDESLEYVVAHEVGHTLGLMHNMGASATIPVDSLRSKTFTAKYGTTPSIMDYARFNYIAQPGDKGVKLTPPFLGIYDEYAIAWLYKPVTGAKNMWEEAAAAEKMVDDKASDPMYAYGAQQLGGLSGSEYDPSARSEDLGDNPLKAGDYGISNLKYILPNMNTWINDDPDRTHRYQLYNEIASQYYRYLDNSLAQVGGIYLRQVKDGTPGQPVSPVSGKIQKASLRWVISQVRASSWLDNKEVTSRFILHTPFSCQIGSMVASELCSQVPEKVLLSASIAGESASYSISDYYSDLYKDIFKAGDMTEAVRTLQRSVVSSIAKPVAASRVRVSFNDTPEFTCYGEESFGESDAPYQKSVRTTAIDENAGCRMIFLKKVAKMARRRRLMASGKNKAHYEYLFRTASEALGK